MNKRLLDAEHAQVAEEANEKIRRLIAGVGTSNVVSFEQSMPDETPIEPTEFHDQTPELPHAS